MGQTDHNIAALLIRLGPQELATMGASEVLKSIQKASGAQITLLSDDHIVTSTEGSLLVIISGDFYRVEFARTLMRCKYFASNQSHEFFQTLSRETPFVANQLRMMLLL